MVHDFSERGLGTRLLSESTEEENNKLDLQVGLAGQIYTVWSWAVCNSMPINGMLY